MSTRSVVLLLLFTSFVRAHDFITTRLTWSQEISRIIGFHCGACHGPNSKVPLRSYEQARPWAKAIKEQVLNRTMPPWGAVAGFGDFQGDPSLSQDEIQRLAEWVEGGAPEGNPIFLPSGLKSYQGAVPVPRGQRSRRTILQTGSEVAAIRPLASVPAAKMTAHLPDGNVQPLLWLRAYDARSRRTFVYRKPVSLPAGTSLVTEPPFPFEVTLFPAARRPVDERYAKNKGSSPTHQP